MARNPQRFERAAEFWGRHTLGARLVDEKSLAALAYGEPFSGKSFGNMISTAICEAGLPERCNAHGLRKAAARRPAEAACSASEIAGPPLKDTFAAAVLSSSMKMGYAPARGHDVNW
jgi:hypothetical protein